jgi:hypothetical protein
MDDTTAYDNAVKEQRAHEVALEIMKMGFQARFETLETESNGDKVVPVDDLVALYNAAFNLMTRS